MADVPGKFFSATKVRTGVAPSSSGSLVGEPLPPVNPPGSSLNSVGLTMPSAFTVSNSPLTANGTIGVAGAGTVGQYIRGDGSLADFPESSGGGSSVSYYLNGSISQGTIGGIAYKEMNKVPILGAGTDFTINADGYIASFLTDVGDPNLLEIPGGNWNFETYFSASSSGGTPTFYVELYKYDGTTFTLIASSVSAPELIAFGTTLTPYFSSLAVPTTTLALTDRLAVRYYVTHSGRTITMHTENNHLCQIITTFTTGLTALNGLTAQVQNFAVGTSGTDFNIASATATHTFNLPTASATNRGALSSADWALFTQAYNDKINSAAVTGTTTKTLTLTQQDGGTITASWSDLNTDAVTSVFGRTGAVVAANGDYTTAQVTESGNLYYTEARVSANTDVAANTAARHNAVTLGTANGLSLSTQVLSLGLASGSTTGALSSTDWNTFNSKQPALSLTTTGTSGAATLVGSTLNIPQYQAAGTYVTSVTASSPLASSGGTTPNITIQQASGSQNGFLSSTDWTTFNNKQNALTNPVTGTGTTNYLPKFTGSTTIGNSLFTDNGTNAGYNNAGVAARTFIIQATSGRPLALEVIENSNVHAIYLYPNNSGFNRISSDYMSGGTFLPLSLTGRENNADLVCQTSGNITIGTTSDNGARLQVSGTATFSSTGNAVRISSTSTASNVQLYITNNNNGDIYAGISASDGSSVFTGTTAYSGYIGTNLNVPFYIATNGTVRLSISSTGAATFSNTLLTGGDITVSKSGDSGINLNTTTTNGVAVTRYQTTAAGSLWATGINITGADSRWEIYNFALGVSPFRISTTGAATFSSTLACSGAFIQPNQTEIFASAGASNRAYAFGLSNAAAGDFVIMQGSTATGGTYTPRLAISPTGNVLIGTATNASGKLQVLGSDSTIIAQLKSSSGMLQFYPFFSAVNGPIIQALDGAGANYATLRVECTTMTVAGNQTVNGSLALPHITKSANYTLTSSDYTVGFDCASNRTATLPDATTCSGRIYVIYQYNTGSGARSVTLDGNGSQTINGATTYSLSPYCDFTSVMIQSNGSNWIIIASNLTADCL